MRKKINTWAFLFVLIIYFYSQMSLAYSVEHAGIKTSIKKDSVVYFILQKGKGFKYPEISSVKVKRINLKFGEALEYEDKNNINGIIWYKCSIRGRYFYLPDQFIDEKKYFEYKLDERGNIIIGTARIDRLYSLPLNYVPSDLVFVDAQMKAKGYEWRKLRLRMEAKKMFEKMILDAEKDGIHISIISAFRDSSYQSMLYTRAIRRNGLKENSVAKPGHSEHQLGTACDLTSDEINYMLSTLFEKTLAYRWLTENSWRYGIFLTYPRLKQRVTGYTYEPWHFRYWGKDHWKKIFSRYSIKIR